ncbi:MAG: 3-oxoacyl-ACP reductase [Alphaproteobacteria bacterium]|nr:3-oxoacyl-ACP reductase [Alphaproteobacteria bacterium]
MSDFLVDLSGKPTARRLMSGLGVPVPQRLRRLEGPWPERPLAEREVVVGGHGALQAELAPALGEAGAQTVWAGEGEPDAPWSQAAEAWGRPLITEELDRPREKTRPHALVLDATELASVEDLGLLRRFLGPRVRDLARCGRVVVLGRTPESCEALGAAAAQSALDGFTRSLSKELGRKGSTANLLRVEPGAERRVAGPLRWLLSDASAFVTGQTLTLRRWTPRSEPVWTRPLDGKLAVVTGAARGIGKATARRLAQEGAHVLLLDRPADIEVLQAAAAEVGGEALPVDITDESAARIIAERAAPRGGLDVLVHNAGVTRDRTLGKMTPEQWDLVMAVNLQAIQRVTEALLDPTLEGGLVDGARLVLLSSVVGLSGNFGQTNYAASKAGVLGLVRHLAKPLAPRGVRIHAVAPGFIETRMTAAIPFATREGARRLSALSQGGLPIDIAEAVVFLASPGASGLTGDVLRVCGGQMLGA